MVRVCTSSFCCGHIENHCRCRQGKARVLGTQQPYALVVRRRASGNANGAECRKRTSVDILFQRHIRRCNTPCVDERIDDLLVLRKSRTGTVGVRFAWAARRLRGGRRRFIVPMSDKRYRVSTVEARVQTRFTIHNDEWKARQPFKNMTGIRVNNRKQPERRGTRTEQRRRQMTRKKNNETFPRLHN